jgi:hypothetical protein
MYIRVMVIFKAEKEPMVPPVQIRKGSKMHGFTFSQNVYLAKMDLSMYI